MATVVQQLPEHSPADRRDTRSESIYQQFLIELEQHGFTGDIENSYGSRLIAATDNSIYQRLPQGVVYPRSTDDVKALFELAQTAEFQSIRFAPRGGGTGTNGQSLTHWLVIDVSRHMRTVLRVDAHNHQVTCQAGVIKDQLNDEVRSAGLFFSPDLSTSNRATIGGMINTDASGQGSLVYGKTSDHILGLTAVLINGEVIHTAPIALSEARQRAKGQSMEAGLYRQAIASCVEQRVAIDAMFPPLNRFLTGYDLKHAYDPENETIDLSRLIAGSEGTLAVVTEATLNLTAIPSYRVLVNVKYSDFQAALRHAPTLVKARATSVETIDSNVLNLAREDIIWRQVAEHLQDVADQTMNGINMVEFTATDQATVDEKVAQLLELLANQLEQPDSAGLIGYQVCSDLASIQSIYAMRKKAVGLLGATKGRRKPVAFVEDTAVPPEHLADFIMEFRAILDSHQLHYGMFGHVDAGVLHVRPALDMLDPEDEQRIPIISDQVAALTARYNGLMWGEHGKGYRSEYAPKFFGELYPEIQKIKAAFDPRNRLNPGKLATPFGSADKLQGVKAELRGHFDRQIPIAVREDYQAALNCNGNGLCFNYVPESTMCPSYKATGKRQYSPKGRATLVREWLRLNSLQGMDVSGIPPRRRWLDLRFKPNLSPNDFNHEVKAAMDTCLACKACATQCPVKVDVPNFRARFLSWYHQRYGRPAKDLLVRDIERMAPILARFPRLSNVLTHNPLTRWLLKQSYDYVDAPKLSVPSLRQQWDWPVLDADHILALPKTVRDNAVIIVQDPFTSFYDAQVVAAFGHVVAAMGMQPILLRFIGNGKAQHVKGFLTEFSATVARVGPQLQRLADGKMNLVGLDASTFLCFQDEYQQFAPPGVTFDFTVMGVQAWLLANQQQLAATKHQHQQSEWQLLLHCTEQTAIPDSAKQWQTVFEQIGLQLRLTPTGCCGMAGTFGHEKAHQATSRKLFDMTWQEPLRRSDIGSVATGFSCRSQAHRFADKAVLHPIQIVAQSLTG